MTAPPDALILATVHGLAGLYTLAVYRWMAWPRGRDQHRLRGSERLGLAVLLGILLLAVANNFLTALGGSVASAVILLVVPIFSEIIVGVRGGWRSVWADLRPTLRRDAAAWVVVNVLLLTAASKLFFWRFVSGGLQYPDLPYHVGRTVEQAFQSSPGFFPLSPLAFPSPLPFQAFVADSLVSATFRYLPVTLHAANYSQVLFGWLILLWTGAALIAGSGAWRAAVVLLTVLLAAPLGIWGLGHVGQFLFVLFHANPNSAIAWPLGLALTFHLYRSWVRQRTPSLLCLVAIPSASVFFKPNEAFAFAFLQLVGLVLTLRSEGHRTAARWALYGAAGWLVAGLAALSMGAPPLPLKIVPSLENIRRYGQVAFPNLHAGPEVFRAVVLYLLGVTAVAAGAILVRSRGRARNGRVADILRREVLIPLSLLMLSLGYVTAGWWLVAPAGPPPQGEPMHVNFDLIVWLGAVIAAGAVCNPQAAAPVGTRKSGFAPAAAGLGALACLHGFWVWTLNVQTWTERGALPLHYHGFDQTTEREVRELLKTQVPEGHCFTYGRRYALYVGSPHDPDTVMAITGCPVLNGERWRGTLGDNRPDLLRRASTIEVSAGPPFTLVVIGDDSRRPGNVPREAESVRAVEEHLGRPSFLVSTVNLAWALDPVGFTIDPPFTHRSALKLYVRVLEAPTPAETVWVHLYRDGQAIPGFLDIPADPGVDLSEVRPGDFITLTFRLTLEPGLYQAYTGSSVTKGIIVPLGWIVVGEPDSPTFNTTVESIRRRGNKDRANEILRLAR